MIGGITAIDGYLNNLRQQYEVRQDGDGCLLLTPFYLPDNTRVGVHLVDQGNGAVILTDLGETFDYLFLSGLNLTPMDKRIKRIGRQFDVTIEGGQISKVADRNTVDESVPAVIQAVLTLASFVSTR